MTDHLLKATNVAKSYHDGERELKVLRKASFHVARGEIVAIVGMSGSGKSTLMHLLGGLDVVDAGEIVVDGEAISGLPQGALDKFRNSKIGFVFQFHHLLPEFNALENIMMPALIMGRPRSEIEPRAQAALASLGLSDRATHRPSRLSGGEQQRIALARALINKPALLLADEPTGNLDLATGEAVIKMMWDTVKEGDRGLVIVTHELSIARRAHRILHLMHGELNEVASEELEGKLTAATR